MKNVYDIRFEKSLYYILSLKADGISGLPYDIVHKYTAIILYLYYSDTVEDYYRYMDDIPSGIDIYIISSQQDVLDQVKKHNEQSDRACKAYILKENTGRDVSALLVTCKEIVKQYKYICFLHDKKAHSTKMEKDTKLWIENLWGNLIGSAYYIDSLLRLLEENDNLGILAPPDPIGEHFFTWYGYGWHGSYEVTKNIADKLELKADINMQKPPITIGTALWFKREALAKLFDADWKYTDFDDSQLDNPNYLSYGVERIFPYVAQDNGYDSGTVMSAVYAEKQTNYLQYMTTIIFSEAQRFFPLPTVNAINCYKKNYNRMIDFAKRNNRFYLYGAGDMGRFCLNLLQNENCYPEGYIISKKNGNFFVAGLPVYSIDEFDRPKDIAIIITVSASKARAEIIAVLESRNFNNYMEFWLE